MNIYQIDFELQAKRILPPKKRYPVMIAWLIALLKPLKILRNDIFDTYRPDIVERMAYNSQTIVLEAMLNKRYGIISSPFIYIINQLIDSNGMFISLTTPASDYVPEDYTGLSYVGISYSLTDVDFIIRIPSAISFLDGEVRAFVDRYKTLGTTYLVQSY